MPDKAKKKAWQRKLHISRAGTPTPSRPDLDETDENRSNISYGGEGTGFRKTAQNTPTSTRPRTQTGTQLGIQVERAPSFVPYVDEGYDDLGNVTPTRSPFPPFQVPSAPTTPRRKGMPKFARNLSSYLSLSTLAADPAASEAPPVEGPAIESPADEDPEFIEVKDETTWDPNAPWRDDFPPPWQPIIDPIISMEGVWNHALRYPGRPIPPDCISGLLRGIEEFRDLRDKVWALQQVKDQYIKEKAKWENREKEYQAKLQLLHEVNTGTLGTTNALGTNSGVTQQANHKGKFTPTGHVRMSKEELDEKSRRNARRMSVRRQVSPSRWMAALSRRLGEAPSGVELRIGKPPEVDLNESLIKETIESHLSNTWADDSNSDIASTGSAFSEPGDMLPDEIEGMHNTIDDVRAEEEAFLVLRDLSVVFAQRRGIDFKSFFPKLTALLSGNDEAEPTPESPEITNVVPEEICNEQGCDHTDMEMCTPRRHLRHFRSQPLLSSEQARRRHFSFEPGDDQLAMLNQAVDLHTASKTVTPPKTSVEPNPFESAFRSKLGGSFSSLHNEEQKPSKIPSPIHRTSIANVRRQISGGNLQPASIDEHVQRQDSTSSVLTAFRLDPEEEAERNPSTKSRKDRGNGRQSVTPSQPEAMEAMSHQIRSKQPKNRSKSMPLQCSPAAVAAARAANQSKNTSPPLRIGKRKGSRQSTTRVSSGNVSPLSPPKLRTRTSSNKKNSENERPTDSSY